MTRYISKLAAMLLAALLLPQTLLAGGIHAKAAEDFAQSKAMRGAKAGVCVIDMTTGEVVASLNEDIALTPASITKIITSAAAIKALSPNYRFSTEVVIDGLVDHAGVVNGNLIINAGLDPTLESRHFPEHESFIVGTIEGLKRLGIKRINGKVIVNESICPEPGVPADWEDADVTEDYGAGAHALNYADNQCSIIFDVSGKKAMIIDTLPHQSNLKIRNNVKVTTWRKSNWTPSASRKKNSNNLIVWGFVKRQDELVELKTTTPDPANALTCDLTEAIVCEGIPVMNRNIKSGSYRRTVYVHQSPLLQEIASSLLFRSDNMYAEAVLRAIALHDGPSASREMALRSERAVLADWGIDIKGQTIYDGSGLARTNHYSPHFLATVLTAAATDPQIGLLFPTLLPVCGQEGTVKKLLKDTPLDGKIALKSGSMTRVQCYAGYYPTGNPKYAVVVMANNFSCNYDALKKSIEDLLLGLFTQE